MTNKQCPSWRFAHLSAKPKSQVNDTSGLFFQPIPACLVAGKPETRQFKAIYLVNDAEVGQASDILVLVCQP